MTQELFRDDSYLSSCPATVVAVRPDGIVLDRTVFYYESGGQPGDVGRLVSADGRAVPIADTKRDRATGALLHVPAPGAPALAAGDAVTAEIDWPRRHRLMRMHSCMHLLSALVPGQVTGGQVGDGKGRLDFAVATDALDREKIEAALNEFVARDLPLAARWITDAELAAQPELVRTMSVKPPTGAGRVRLIEVAGIDLQPCGGTHVRRTGEIGRVAVVKIENKGKQNRRVNLALAAAAPAG
jgi:misacylated tRNA(Ala) deacylase